MKAYICEKYGPPEVLELKEVEKPVPGEREVLVRVHATTVNAADCNARGLSHIPRGLGFLAKMMMGSKKPKISIQGSVVAGVVESAGRDVESFLPGDLVYGSSANLGGYAEYANLSVEGALVRKPDSMTFEQVATIPYGALTALYFLRDKGHIKSGQKVLVIGASGGVGVYAVQLAKYFGAEVTGVCSTANVEFVKSLGADRVIDYKKEDPVQTGEKWDIILDVVVGKTSFARYKKILNARGYYLAVAGGLNDLLQMIWTSIKGGRKVIFGGGTACEKKENLLLLNELMETGKLDPVIDRVFPFERLVDAHRYVESGQKKGNVAVVVSS